MWEDQVRVWLHIWLSGPGGGQAIKKGKYCQCWIFCQYFMKILEEIKDIPDLIYSKKQTKNDPTEAYFFLVKKFSGT